jgi:hypothetical protein
VEIDTTFGKTVGITYNFYNDKEYINLLDAMPKAGFDKVGRMIYGDSETNQEFKKGEIHLLVSVKTFDGDRSWYSMSLCYCSLPENFNPK